MIFSNLDKIPKDFGKKRKAPCTHKRMRSNMMLNPLKLKHLNCIDESEADMITLNLEDAIAPSRKKEALENIALFLSHLEHSPSFVIVRVNSLAEGGAEEIAFLNDFAFDAIRLPKVKSQEEIDEALSILGKEKALHISLETKEALAMLSNIKTRGRLSVVNLGILDLLSSLDLPQSLVCIGNPSIDYILSKFLIDAKTAGLHPISFMFQDYENVETFRTWCEHEKRLGFESKACMGPKQVSIAHEVFKLEDKALERAKHIKKAFETQAGLGVNGFMDADYGFIDEPIYRDSLLILSKEKI